MNGAQDFMLIADLDVLECGYIHGTTIDSAKYGAISQRQTGRNEFEYEYADGSRLLVNHDTHDMEIVNG